MCWDRGDEGMELRIDVLIGCTASGKSGTGLELARACGGEIVSIDSMKIYRHMDVGTAKPSAEARAEIPHHMIDVAEPSESFGLGRYVEMADDAIRDIVARGKRAIVVGGTMMFVRGLIEGVFEGPGADPAYRAELRGRAEREGSAVLHGELAKIDPEAAARIHPNDLRRIERAMEVYHVSGKPITELQQQWGQSRERYDCRLVALRRPKEEASRRINVRVKRMIDAGLVDEVRLLLAEPEGIGEQAAQAVGYAEISDHLAGKLSLDEAVEQIKINTRRLAKHQRTWMRRIPGIQWVDLEADDSAPEVAARVLEAWE